MLKRLQYTLNGFLVLILAGMLIAGAASVIVGLLWLTQLYPIPVIGSVLTVFGVWASHAIGKAICN